MSGDLGFSRCQSKSSMYCDKSVSKRSQVPQIANIPTASCT